MHRLLFRFYWFLWFFGNFFRSSRLNRRLDVHGLLILPRQTLLLDVLHNDRCALRRSLEFRLMPLRMLLQLTWLVNLWLGDVAGLRHVRFRREGYLAVGVMRKSHLLRRCSWHVDVGTYWIGDLRSDEPDQLGDRRVNVVVDLLGNLLRCCRNWLP